MLLVLSLTIFFFGSGSDSLVALNWKFHLFFFFRHPFFLWLSTFWMFFSFSLKISSTPLWKAAVQSLRPPLSSYSRIYFFPESLNCEREENQKELVHHPPPFLSLHSFPQRLSMLVWLSFSSWTISTNVCPFPRQFSVMHRFLHKIIYV